MENIVNLEDIISSHGSVPPLLIPAEGENSFNFDVAQDPINDEGGEDLDNTQSFAELVVQIAQRLAAGHSRIGGSGFQIQNRNDSLDDEPVRGLNDLEAMPPSSSANVGTTGSQSISAEGKNEFVVGQTFLDKEAVLYVVKSYSIRRQVQYKVYESDHIKYHGRCVKFGYGLIIAQGGDYEGIWANQSDNRSGGDDEGEWVVQCDNHPGQLSL